MKPSVWDNRSESWIPAHVWEARNPGLKSRHLMNLDAESPTHHDNEDEDEDEEDGIGLPGNKKRKLGTGPEERTFVAKKWVKIPAAQAEQMGEKKYLADRRPGMESLYGGAYKSTNGYGAIGVIGTSSTGMTGFDLGDGSGLGNALGGMSNGNAPVQTPVRKNMPPKRKKKKGGPGRKKAVRPEENGEDVKMADGAPQEQSENTETKHEEENKEDGDEEEGSSGSEDEGSEEGEIDEGNRADEKSKDVDMTEAPMTDVQSQPVETASTNELALGDVPEAEVVADDIKEVKDESVPPQLDPIIAEIPIPTTEITDANPLEPVIEPQPVSVPDSEHVGSIEQLTEPQVPEQMETAETEVIQPTLPEPVLVPLPEMTSQPPAIEPILDPVATSVPEPISATVVEPAIPTGMTNPLEKEIKTETANAIEGVLNEEKIDSEPAVVSGEVETVADKLEKVEQT